MGCHKGLVQPVPTHTSPAAHSGPGSLQSPVGCCLENPPCLGLEQAGPVSSMCSAALPQSEMRPCDTRSCVQACPFHVCCCARIERAHQARLAADAPAASPQPSPLGQPPLPPLPPEDDGAPPPPPPPLPPHMPDVPCHPFSVPPAPAAHAQPRAPASVPPGRWNGQGQAHAPAAAAMTGAGWQGSAGDAAAQPTPPPPPMAFSFGAPRSGGAAPAPAAKPAGGFSMSARKAALKPAVAGFGLDSDEET